MVLTWVTERSGKIKHKNLRMELRFGYCQLQKSVQPKLWDSEFSYCLKESNQMVWKIPSKSNNKKRQNKKRRKRQRKNSKSKKRKNSKNKRSESKLKQKKIAWPVRSSNKSLALSVLKLCTFRSVFSHAIIGFVALVSLSLSKQKSLSVLLAEKIWQQQSETQFSTVLWKITLKLIQKKKDLINKKSKPERKIFSAMIRLTFNKKYMARK